ncbi:MAG TPA: class I SAM-dependent methyltransferase [Vicinamibacterales bacterium]|nr:class I SAM-dependent methyltransferase [Vicinamibacterales bacterium]
MTGPALSAALDRVDRVLAACGGGPTLVVGDDSGMTLRALRQRGVPARAGGVDACADAASVDVIWLEGVLDPGAEAEALALLARVCARRPRALVASVSGRRDEWECRVLRHGWRKHPLYQQLADYAALDGETEPLLLFEPVPAGVSWGGPLDDLAAGRDLHMDMLREAGRRADAHVARYMWARRFVRPGDRVLDAACGLGYGSRLLVDGTLADSVLGLDVDQSAITYAAEHYGAASTRLSYAVRDLSNLADLPDASFDVIVSFETVEHLEDPERFLAGCRRLLTPGGRFVCSVPNEWLDERGVDPNPHHLHVFDRARLEALCGRHFLLEHVFGQTAGGGMKLSEAGRALWDASTRTDEAEWWLAVGMSPPFGQVADPVATRWLPEPIAETPTVIAFARDYEHPWLVRALVSIGQRTESAALLEQLAGRVAEEASSGSADQGAALCVRAYRQLSTVEGVTGETNSAIERYCGLSAANPHVTRWQISLRYVQGLAALTAGDHAEAARTLAACVDGDPLVFSPLLATKTVSACWLLGWMAAQARDLSGAARWWRAGVHHAERALHRPWSELMADRDRPVLFGLREATLVVDLASQCAAGLHLLPHAAERPGILWAQLSDSLAHRLEAQSRAFGQLERTARSLQSAATDAWQRCQRAEAQWPRLEAAGIELECLRSQSPIPWVLGPTASEPAYLRVAVFGTGQGGREALARLRSHGIGVDCFADNNRSRWNDRIDDVPVVDPSTLPMRHLDFIAVASTPGRDAIFAQLRALGYQPGRDFDAMPTQTRRG